MARARTLKFEELILEIQHEADGPWTPICGIMDVTINRTSNVDTSEIPDCDDESLPLSLEKAIRSQEVTVTGNGWYAMQNGPRLYEWWRTGSLKPARLRNAKVEAEGTLGDVVEEQGEALLTTFSNTRTKGQKVSAEIELQFDGIPIPTYKTAV